jgi:hypothetical protein
MAAEVHPGLPGIGKSGHDGEGVRVGAVKIQGQQKQSAAVMNGRRAFGPYPEICYSAPKICSRQPRCQFSLPEVRLFGANLRTTPLFCAATGRGQRTFLIARSLFGGWPTDGLRDSGAGISRSRGRLAHGKDPGVARVLHYWRHSSLPSTSSDPAIRTS